MPYFNYHAQIKKLISSGHMTHYEVLNSYNDISPALVIFFDNHRPMPIREYHWKEYFDIINSKN